MYVILFWRTYSCWQEVAIWGVMTGVWRMNVSKKKKVFWYCVITASIKNRESAKKRAGGGAKKI